MKGPRSLGVVIKLGQSVGHPLYDRGKMPLTTLMKSNNTNPTRLPPVLSVVVVNLYKWIGSGLTCNLHLRNKLHCG